MIDDHSAPMRVIRVDPVEAILIKNIVFDLQPAHRHPENDAPLAVIGHDIVVNLHIGDRRVTGNVQTVSGIAEQHVIDHHLVVPTQVKPMIEIAAGHTIVVDVVANVSVIARTLAGIDSLPAAAVAIVMDLTVQNLVEISFDKNSVSGPAFNTKSIDDVVTAIQIDPLIAVRRILPVDHRSTLHL